MLRLRSWASSMMSVSYFARKRSDCVSASSTPSVISLTSVRSVVLSPNRTLWPTTGAETPSSSATRAATLRAAIRRGCVWPIVPATPRPRSRQILGSWVLLPDPVSPQTTTT